MPKEMGGRYLAAQALMRVEGQGAYSALALDGLLRQQNPPQREAAFAAALFYGVLERKLTLDFCIDRLLRDKVSLRVRQVLRLGFYQLLYMPSVAPRAAVNETVELCRQCGLARAAGLANGVLRAFLRRGCSLEPLPQDPFERLAVLYSCPAALCRAVAGWHGEEALLQWLEASVEVPVVYARANTLRTDAGALCEQLAREGVRAEAAPLEGAVAIREGAWQRSGAFEGGLFHVQDLSSQQCVAFLQPQPGERVLDVCAAPGGKSLTAAQWMQNRGEVVSCDLAAGKLPLIERSAERLGVQIIRTRRQDGRQFDPALGVFDRVLCDVPCSGLGVVGRKPEIKYKPLEEFDPLPQIQYNILQTAARYVRPGGLLVYSTCTISPLENGAVAGRFLQEHPGFAPERREGGWCRQVLPAPGRAGDGFYMAAMRRTR